MGKVTLDLQPELEQAFGQIAQQTGQTRDAVLHEALESYVTRQNIVHSHNENPLFEARVGDQSQQDEQIQHYERRPLRTMGIISDTDVNSTNIKEWLRDNWHPARYE